MSAPEGVRGRVFRGAPIDVTGIDKAEPEYLPPNWIYEVVDHRAEALGIDSLVARGSRASQPEALSACRAYICRWFG